MTYHDDWLVKVLLADGRVYSFMTEMWPEHLDGEPDTETNWPCVIQRAREEALDLAERGTETWVLPHQPKTKAEFRELLDRVCMAASDAEFHRYIRR